MRIKAALLLLASVMASPALAATSPALQPVERQLSGLSLAMLGDVGVAAVDLSTGETVSVRGDDPFPMASTVKVAIAALYLRQVEFGRRSLDQSIAGVSARELMRRMLVHSDNGATDILLRNLGGPAHVQAWFDQQGIKGLRIDRTIAQLLAARRDLMDVRDSSTPLAMIDLLRRLDKAEIINASSRATLLGMMADCKTGKNRIRAGVPYGTLVEHKTGTLNGLSTDVGYLTLPDGRRVAVAIFARYGANRPATIAAATRVIYEGFSSLPRPYARAAAQRPVGTAMTGAGM